MTDFDEKHGQLVRVAFERSYLLQNPYFSNPSLRTFIRNPGVSKYYVSLALSCFAPISQNRVLSALFTMNGKLIRKTIAK